MSLALLILPKKQQLTLISSISGIRGTIGGKPGEGLGPDDIVKFTASYAEWLKKSNKSNLVIIGRDARLSGALISKIVSASLNACGINVIDLGLSTTPTVEMAVPEYNAGGGIILTASHNPKEWNALKLLNDKGEFISAEEGEKILNYANRGAYTFEEVDELGWTKEDHQFIYKHIDQILELPLVLPEQIKQSNFKVVVDGVNSSGGFAIPLLLSKLGVQNIVEVNCRPDGHFAHNPEPLPEHLEELCNTVKNEKADLGISVDPDVDRLALVDENGIFYGEEYTLVTVADYILTKTPGTSVSNMSSTKALRDITEAKGESYFASAVGEVNVVKLMKDKNAVIGGEGNGGIIYPELHYGRDALVGVALLLSYLSETNKSLSELKKSYPSYTITKNKIQLTPEINTDALLEKVKQEFKEYEIDTTDGVKIYFEHEWVHLRKSNTEPIIRLYAESSNPEQAEELASNIMGRIKNLY